MVFSLAPFCNAMLLLAFAPFPGVEGNTRKHGEFSRPKASVRELSKEISLPNRTDEIDTTGLDCSLGPSTSDDPFVPTQVEFWYGVEKNSSAIQRNSCPCSNQKY